MTTFLMFVVACVFIGLALWSSDQECPRQRLGYHCKGYDCDHSREARDRAERQMKN